MIDDSDGVDIPEHVEDTVVASRVFNPSKHVNPGMIRVSGSEAEKLCQVVPRRCGRNVVPQLVDPGSGRSKIWRAQQPPQDAQ